MPKKLKIRLVTDPKARKLKRAALATLNALPVSCFSGLSPLTDYEISLSLVGPSLSQRLNSQYRKKNRPTDVLAFSALEGKVPHTPIQAIGDVVICLSVAKRQAKEYGVPLGEELNRLTVHGVLHLFGYDHERSRREAKRMFTLQEKILAKL